MSQLPFIRKIDCVQLPVSDLAAGLAFYRARLGFELIWRTATAVGLRLPESEVELVLQTERPYPEVDWLVASADEAARLMQEAGGTILAAPFDIPIGRCVVVADPWGNPLVLLDGSKGLYTTDEAGNVTGVA